MYPVFHIEKHVSIFSIFLFQNSVIFGVLPTGIPVTFSGPSEISIFCPGGKFCENINPLFFWMFSRKPDADLKSHNIFRQSAISQWCFRMIVEASAYWLTRNSVLLLSYDKLVIPWMFGASLIVSAYDSACIMNSKGDSEAPCLTPRFTEKKREIRRCWHAYIKFRSM